MQGVILLMGVVYQYVIHRITILSDRYVGGNFPGGRRGISVLGRLHKALFPIWARKPIFPRGERKISSIPRDSLINNPIGTTIIKQANYPHISKAREKNRRSRCLHSLFFKSTSITRAKKFPRAPKASSAGINGSSTVP